MAVSTLSDTTPEAMRVWIDAYRRMPVERKWRNIIDACRMSRALHEAGVRIRIPNASRRAIQCDWRKMALGRLWQPCFAEIPEMDPASLENVPILKAVIAAFDRLGVAYALGGSWASSVLGIERSTRDADLSADPFPGMEEEFALQFDAEFFICVESIRDAIRQRSSFNIIHPASGFKVDVFIRKDTPFAQSVMSRRRPSPVPGFAEPIELVSAEDIILHKLEWFRLGGETSDRQWGDILGVLRVQAGNLDEAYLDTWAAELKVTDLLAKARADAVI